MIRRLPLGSLSLLAVLMAASGQQAMAQVDTPYQTREEQDIFGAGPNDGGSFLDATNPLDLINRIRQSGAMNDATPPGDAIDAALEAYQQDPLERP